jgi:hypothetical protein
LAFFFRWNRFYSYCLYLEEVRHRVCLHFGRLHDGEAKIPEDIVESKRIANELGFEQERIMLNLDEMERVFKKNRTDP